MGELSQIIWFIAMLVSVGAVVWFVVGIRLKNKPISLESLSNDFLGTDIKTVQKRWNKLTVREKEIALLVFDDLSTQEICERLNVTEATVKKHKQNIFEKLEIDKVTKLVKIIVVVNQ